MNFRFLLNDVDVYIVDRASKVYNPLFHSKDVSVNETEFSLHVPELANFYSSNGEKIEIQVIGELNKPGIELYLNGSVLGSILHQRKELPLHASCFQYKDKTVLICGASGAGKSTTAAAFYSRGADFLTDDISPVRITGDRAVIWPISDSIKLWEDSIERLKLKNKISSKIEYHDTKFYLKFNKTIEENTPIDLIIILNYHQQHGVSHHDIKGARKFDILLNQIYRKEYLNGMPELKQYYFKKLIEIGRSCRILEASRNADVDPNSFINYLEDLILDESK